MTAPYHNKALPEGTVLREWRLEEVLGVGGFGIVYRGTDIYFGETVAIKEYFPGAISDRVDGTTVTPTDSSSEDIYQLGRQKFLEEAKVLWGLSHPERHPNIVAVRSLFEIHGTAYMVMDFESGLSLSQMLKDGKSFDEKSLMAIIRPIAEGLERAHRADVLHRDIKPANILVDRQGRPVLIDFGSARFESSQATNTKVTFYTPPYAALEQYVKSYPQGPWTDIYALGVVLYQCVTGKKPPEVLERLHGEDSSLLSAREWPGYSRTFIRAVDAAMAVRPLERPSSISAWLKLFDAEAAPLDDDFTRVAVFSPPPEPALNPAEAKRPADAPAAFSTPVVAAAVSSVTAEDAKDVPRPKGTNKVLAGVFIAIALFALVALASLFIRHPFESAAPTAAVTTQATSTAGSLTDKMNALVEAAQSANVRAGDIAALATARDKLTSLVAAKAPAAELAAVAAEMAKTESDSLRRAERRALRDMTPLPVPDDAPGSADTIAKLQAARTELDTALAPPSSQDASQIVDQVRAALVSFGAFQDAAKAAMPFVVAARRKAFDTLHTDAQAYLNQVAALANVEKPWFLASVARKNAYKLRQDNAVQAKALGQQLDDLAKTAAASTDPRAMTDAVTQAGTIKQSAGALYTSSSAAAL